MGLLKDMWDIVKSEPQVRNWIKNNAKETYKFLTKKFYWRAPTVQEVITQQKMLCSLLQSDEFASAFSDRFSFIEYILCQVIRSVKTKERGILLSKFFVEGTILYFPSISSQINHYHHESQFSSNCGFKLHGPVDIKYYIYAIRIEGTNAKELFEELSNSLDEIVLAPRTESEENLFEKKLFERRLKPNYFAELYLYKNKNIIAFTDGNLTLEPKMNSVLSFKNADQTRKEIASDLEYLHDFKMI